MSFLVFDGLGVLFVYDLLCRPQRTAYRELPSQMATHLRTGSPLLAGESAGFEARTVGLQSGVATNEPPLLPNEPPLLPSHIQLMHYFIRNGVVSCMGHYVHFEHIPVTSSGLVEFSRCKLFMNTENFPVRNPGSFDRNHLIVIVCSL